MVFDTDGYLLVENPAGSGRLTRVQGPLVTQPTNAHAIITEAYNRALIAYSDLKTPKAPINVYGLNTQQLDPYGQKPLGAPWLASTPYLLGDTIRPPVTATSARRPGAPGSVDHRPTSDYQFSRHLHLHRPWPGPGAVVSGRTGARPEVPPSTGRTIPVIWAERSLARYTTVFATSAGRAVPGQRLGQADHASDVVVVIPVAMCPGREAFARIPFGPSSTAIDRVKWMTAALAAR